MRPRPGWDVFCRVIDNHGDIGVAWRLCADLAGRGEHVRLWVDDPSALAWMAPRGCAGVELVAWTDSAPDLTPGGVVVETFGCDPPPRFVQRIAECRPAPAWINLEYLSAEPYAEGSHGLPSPVNAAHGRVLVKYFFFPGFSARSGGLLREPGLMAALAACDRDHWLRENGVALQAGERLASLFCYDNPQLDAVLDRLGEQPTLLLVCPGAATLQVAPLLGPAMRRGRLRAHALPYLTQAGYDRLLWSCDLNFVRGEDSFVRAQWAGKPFVWQIYPQRDDAHRTKLVAFLDRMLAGARDASLEAALRKLFLGWNALAPLNGALPEVPRWRGLCEDWRNGLHRQDDLCTQLVRFVRETR